jgi:hypothetical protein
MASRRWEWDQVPGLLNIVHQSFQYTMLLPQSKYLMGREGSTDSCLNPSYWGGRDLEDCGSKPAPGEILHKDPILKIPNT